MDQKHNEFLSKFMARVPSDIQDSFTDEQLNAVHKVFGDRSWGAHTVDIRGTGQWLKQRFYYVLLMGRESRSIDRIRAEQRMRPIRVLFATSIIFIFLFSLFGIFSIGLYSTKMAFGIDVFPNIDMLPDQSIKQFLQELFQ